MDSNWGVGVCAGGANGMRWRMAALSHFIEYRAVLFLSNQCLSLSFMLLLGLESVRLAGKKVPHQTSCYCPRPLAAVFHSEQRVPHTPQLESSKRTNV